MLSLDLNLVWNIVNLVVLYLLLRHFLFKPVMGIMDKRKKIIEDGLKNAQDAQSDAKKMKQEYEEIRIPAELRRRVEAGIQKGN